MTDGKAEEIVEEEMEKLEGVGLVGLNMEKEIKMMKEVQKKNNTATSVQKFAEFTDLDSFKAAPVFTELKHFFTKRKTWESQEGRKETYVCKFSQRRGYKVCKRRCTVTYPDTDFRVLVFEEEEHFHEEDSSYKTTQNYHWTKQQEAIEGDQDQHSELTPLGTAHVRECC